jgi:membrane protein YqaA with SNARE-associated domain
MWWQYLMVFFGAIIVDITPLPLPPAFTMMIILQSAFDLSIWPVIVVGVAGSAIGRLILAYYIPAVADRILSAEKNEDIRLLGEKIKTKGFRAQLFILIYTLLPLSSTPLFIAGGIAKVKPFYIIPAFIIGKFTTDSIAVFMGKYVAENKANFVTDIFSLESIAALLLFFLLIFCLLFINWRTFIHTHKIQFKFNIWR